MTKINGIPIHPASGRCFRRHMINMHRRRQRRPREHESVVDVHGHIELDEGQPTPFKAGVEFRYRLHNRVVRRRSHADGQRRAPATSRCTGIDRVAGLLTQHHNAGAKPVVVAFRIGRQDYREVRNHANPRIQSSWTSETRTTTTTIRLRRMEQIRTGIQNEFNFFVKDDWKVTPSLTLNLGMR